MEDNFVERDNILEYAGDVNTLPRCPLCEVGEGSAHTYATFDHPYKMRPEEKPVAEQTEEKLDEIVAESEVPEVSHEQ